MRALIQRVSEASIKIDGEVYSTIDSGLLVLLGIENDDSQVDIDWLVKKISLMRIFEDADGKMNKSVIDVNGSLLIVSQFTLHASTKKGNRPSFINAARPEFAIPLYEQFIEDFKELLPVKTGDFGADMKVTLVNDGPVTIWLDSKNKE
jgi:D-tyrosyl-tRNA(Tyr) deacylase